MCRYAIGGYSLRQGLNSINEICMSVLPEQEYEALKRRRRNLEWLGKRVTTSADNQFKRFTQEDFADIFGTLFDYMLMHGKGKYGDPDPHNILMAVLRGGSSTGMFL